MSLIRINRNPSRKDLILFGFLWIIFFGAFGTLFFYKWHSIYLGLTLWFLAIITPITGLLLPSFMRLVYIGMAYATSPIGFILSYVILALVYYLVVTPIGLAMRIARYDPMKKRFASEAESYWIKREPRTSIKRYFRQF
ncbi:MAG: hypothetical protein DF168_01813 [Candidatus Moanabacter tarae]|uniref:SxtJ n=1 Tax=Candidatus Moanibacter tarae TaxID=2200854 RepID=A0A2Z4AHD7_9BACT|nr:MAG: hypothetical protein DF168_01813 [Candidatus Moanabacter tarae]|tara:strand:+ start:36565 stop:36981 length:417 start_codon:yes stop_codon:yes gene_type:complete